MRTNLWTMWRIVAALFLFTAGPAAADPASQPASTDWPQWRGPTRDGIAPVGPKLLDAWPKGGPKLLWKSDPIPSGPYGQEGGAGSPVVADGKVFLFIDSQRVNGKVVLTTEDLIELGWAEGAPDDLEKNIETEGWKTVWGKKLTGAALDAYIKEFMAPLDPKLVEKFGAHIQQRLKQEWSPVPWTWVQLSNWAAIRDKEFPTLNELLNQVRDESHYGNYRGMIQTLLLERHMKCSDIVLCLDAATGKQIWRQEFPGAPSNRVCNFGASGTPAIWGGKCYATGSAGFYCLNVKDGSVVWQAKAKFGDSSALVMDGVVYVSIPELTAFDAKTGKVLWTSPLVNGASVVPWSSGGKHYVVAEATNSLLCIDAVDGKVAWRAPAEGSGATPVMLGDTLIFRPGNHLEGFKCMPLNAEKLWLSDGGGHDEGSPLVIGDCVVSTGGECNPSGQMYCCDLKTGKKLWNRPYSAQMSIRCSSPILADGKMITLANATDVIMLKITPEKYEELGRFSPKAADCTSPAIAGGKLFLRLKDCVACYDLRANEN